MALKDIRLVRDINATVNGVVHELKAGWQKVEEEVANDWFVKAHTDTNGNDSNVVDTRDAQILELSGQVGKLNDELAKANEASANARINEQKVTDLTNDLAAMTQARDNALTDNTEMGRKIGELQTKLDAASAPAAPAADAAVTTTESKSTKK